jgi:dienelactone hydrolase
VTVLAGCADPAPSTLTPTLAPETTAAQAVTFPGGGGATLSGKWFGGGPRASTTVVLSNMSDNNPAAWERFAAELATPDVGVLTYSYSYSYRGGPDFISADADAAVRDLNGAVAYARQRAAGSRLVLVGASLGGMAVAKRAAALHADAVVVIGSPNRRPEFDLRVTNAEVAAITVPKLFIVSADDSEVPPEQSRLLFDAAGEPKRWQSYPGTAHGTQLLTSTHAEDVRRLLVEFIAASPR